ncbi:MAG: hypothetical protein AAF518_09930 [Spirochaetota bacterium]
MSIRKQKVLKVNRWTSNVHNSNEKRVKQYLKSILPEYKDIVWDEKRFQFFYIDVLNSLPSRYKQKNSIELSGRLKKEVIEDAIHEKLLEIRLEQNELENESKENSFQKWGDIRILTTDSLQEEAGDAAKTETIWNDLP